MARTAARPTASAADAPNVRADVRSVGSARTRIRAAGALGALGRAATATLAAFAVALPAAADDLDVYRARLAAEQKPNILFVLDFSGSMLRDVDGEFADESGRRAKIDILREAISEVLADNVDTIEAGLGSVYDGRPSGVRWPVAPLDADPATVDPDIPAGRYTMAGVIGRQMDRRAAGGATATVDALVEAARYFRGDPVGNGGADPKRPALHRPDVWVERADPALSGYAGGDMHAAIAASYAPADAWDPDRPETGNVALCRNYAGAGGANGCAGLAIVAGSCGPVERGWRQVPTGEYVLDDAHEACLHRVDADWDAPTYRSPIGGQCGVSGTNAIVLVSDGQPTERAGGEALASLLGTGEDACEDLSSSVFGDPAETAGNCGPELAAALAGTPQRPGIGRSEVLTYTIGFDTDGPGRAYLERLAAAGGPPESAGSRFFVADEADELKAALRNAVDGALGLDNQSFTELAVGVNRQALSSDDRAFTSLFVPSEGRAWRGNLKGYFLGPSGLLDIDGREATAGGAFLDTARSFWLGGADPDGASTTRGGASARLDPDARRLYTDAGDGSDRGRSLAGDANARIDPTNAAIAAADLGLPNGSPMRDEALGWLRTAPMGDPLHSKSVTIDYAGPDGAREVVYIMTNQGLLHAIDATRPTAPGDGTAGSGDVGGGEELFAYMPRRLLANLPALASSDRANGNGNGDDGSDHIYGLDGDITPWHEDADGDGVVDPGESLLLVLGMRRGGSAYHAIDASDPTDPRPAWTIDDASPGFAKLAQSWSRAALVNVRRGTGEERVLVFGGGYAAERLDGRSKRRGTDGNAVFVVDRSGALVRRFESRDMVHSIAADPTVIDSDADGFADRIYAADVGGRIWRIDFDDPWAANATVTRFADLHAGDAPQPLFSAPSVALIRGRGAPFLSVAVGSGDRTDPLDWNSRNALFVLRDTDVGKGLPSASGIRIGDLYDATDGALDSIDPDRAAAARTALDAARGWRVNLRPGEKSLPRLVSFEGALLATTYEPEDDAFADPCSFDETRRLHTLDIATARPFDLDAGETAPPGSPRSATLAGTGIPGPAIVTYPEGTGRADIVVGNEIEASAPRRLERVYWHAR